MGIQSAWKSSRQEGTLEAKKVHAHTVFETSVEADSSVPQTFAQGRAEMAAKSKATKTAKTKKEGKDVAPQKVKTEDGTVILNQKSSRNKDKQAQKPEEEQQQKLAKEAPAKPLDKEGAAETIQSSKEATPKGRPETTSKNKKEGKDVAVQKAKAEDGAEAKKVNAQTVVEKSGEANSSGSQTVTLAGGEKEATPKGKETKPTKSKKQGKDVAVQKVKTEDGTVILNQKSSRNKDKQVQKPEEEQQQKLAKDALTKPLDNEGAVATIQSAWKSSRQEGTLEAKKVHAHTVFETSVEADSSVPQTFAQGRAEMAAKSKATKTAKTKKEGKDVAPQKVKTEA